MTYVIVDPGSCHDGDFNKACDLIDIAEDCNANAIKFQLLTDNELTDGNILLPWEWLPKLMEYNEKICVFASVFNQAGLEYMIDIDCPQIKFAYSKQDLFHLYTYDVLDNFEDIFISSDLMNIRNNIDHISWLYCIPEYPVPYRVNLDTIFDKFDGFSSHCLGISQEIKAVNQGANTIEFHMKGDWYSPCPDWRFAKTPEQTKKLIEAVKWHT